jgi:uncharacterized protein YlaI
MRQGELSCQARRFERMRAIAKKKQLQQRPISIQVSPECERSGEASKERQKTWKFLRSLDAKSIGCGRCN